MRNEGKFDSDLCADALILGCRRQWHGAEVDTKGRLLKLACSTSILQHCRFMVGTVRSLSSPTADLGGDSARTTAVQCNGERTSTPCRRSIVLAGGAKPSLAEGIISLDPYRAALRAGGAETGVSTCTAPT